MDLLTQLPLSYYLLILCYCFFNFKGEEMKNILFNLLLVVTFNTFADTPPENKILGFWLSENGKAVIEIYKKDGEYNGKMVWLLKQHSGEIAVPLDVNNDDKELQKRKLLGLNILTGFKYKDGEFTGGRVYDPESGNTYKAYMELKTEDKIKLRGYIGISLFGRTSYWTRENQKLPGKYLNKKSP